MAPTRTVELGPARKVVWCPATSREAHGTCTRDGGQGRCVYVDAICSCDGPALWWLGGCGAGAYPAGPVTFAWSCKPRLRPDGCPTEQPRSGAACVGTMDCSYIPDPEPCHSEVLSTHPQLVACSAGHWAVESVDQCERKHGQPEIRRAAAPSPASQTSASLEGVVTDRLDGAPILGAVIALASPRRGESHQAVTDRDGHYRFDSIAPGPYRLELARFYEELHRDLVLRAGDALIVDATLGGCGD